MAAVTAILFAPSALQATPVAIYFGANNSIYRVNSDGSAASAVVNPTESGWGVKQWVIDDLNQRIYSAEEPSVGVGNTRIFSTAMDGSDRTTIYGGSELGRVNYGMAVDGAEGYVFLHSHDGIPVASSGPSFDGRIQRISISSGAVLQLPPTTWYSRLDTDPASSSLYYTDVTWFSSGGPSIYSLNGIKRSSYDGTSIQSVPVSGVTPDVELVVSAATNKVFFSSDNLGGIYSANLGGGSSALLASTAGYVFIDYDSVNSQLYWLDGGGIHRSAPDGSGAAVVVLSDVVGTSYSRLQVVAVPEPSTYAMALAGLACGGWHVLRTIRRRPACGMGRSLVAVPNASWPI
jgi:hypothetical protein